MLLYFDANSSPKEESSALPPYEVMMTIQWIINVGRILQRQVTSPSAFVVNVDISDYNIDVMHNDDSSMGGTGVKFPN